MRSSFFERKSKLYLLTQLESFEGKQFFKSGNTNWRRRLITVDLLIKVACFVTKVFNFFDNKRADLNWLEPGGQLYFSFPFSKGYQFKNIGLSARSKIS